MPRDCITLSTISMSHRVSTENRPLNVSHSVCRRTTVFVDTRLWKTKHPRKRFQNFRQSCVLLTDRIEQSQPDSMT